MSLLYLHIYPFIGQRQSWTIHTLFIAVTTSGLEESAPAQELLVINDCIYGFLQFFVH